MSFTGAEKNKIRNVLGYPNLFRYRNTRLESALEAADADGEASVRAELAAIAEIDTAIMSGGAGFDAAGVKKVDEVEFKDKSADSVIADLRRLGRIHVSRISVFFGVPIHTDYFSANGYPGDSWTDGMGQRVSQVGFAIRLG